MSAPLPEPFGYMDLAGVVRNEQLPGFAPVWRSLDLIAHANAERDLALEEAAVVCDGVAERKEWQIRQAADDCAEEIRALKSKAAP